MVQYNKAQLGQAAKEFGFVRDTFEKVLRLKEILFFINKEDYLDSHLVLKGGTAINMTIFNLPRLSVDIDMDFIPNLTREEMLEAREKISGLIKGYMTDVFDDNMEVETLEPIEIFAAKTNALLSRAAARDLYDFNNMLYFGLFDESEYDLFRKCIVFYASISAQEINKTFDTSAIDRLTFYIIRRDLFPVLRKKENFDLETRKKEAKEFIGQLMHLTVEEKEYLELFEAKEYKPELLFSDDQILKNIEKHPMALWKMGR